jgi:hyaluronoglucosaminidase
MTKLDSVFDVGVRDFCVLFDDVIGATHALDPEVQVDAVVGVLEHLRARDPATTLCFISHYYDGTAEELMADATSSHAFYPGAPGSSAAYAAYARIPAEVPIMWTGPRVFSNRITVAGAEAFAALAGRPVIVWDNFPVNDNILDEDLFMGPYEGREPGLDGVLHGILVNTMIQSSASKVPLWTVGRALALGTDYDPATAWREALAVVGGSKKGGPLGVIAEHFSSHPFIGDAPESPTLDAAVSEFLTDDSGRTRRRLRSRFRTYVKNEKKLARVLGEGGSHPDPALWDELAGPSEKLRLLSEAGLLALEVLALESRGKPADRTALEAKLAEAEAIPWLVGENRVALSIAPFLSEKTEPNLRDVFGRFFEAVAGAQGA